MVVRSLQNVEKIFTCMSIALFIQILLPVLWCLICPLAAKILHLKHPTTSVAILAESPNVHSRISRFDIMNVNKEELGQPAGTLPTAGDIVAAQRFEWFHATPNTGYVRGDSRRRRNPAPSNVRFSLQGQKFGVMFRAWASIQNLDMSRY